MSVTLKDITQDNFEELISLYVDQEQEQFVASNLYTIAQMQFKEEKIAKGVYVDKIVVGLIAYDLEDYDIWRLMIDARSQGRGYGRKALKLVLDILRKDGRLKTARTCIVVENVAMRNLIVSFGFKENGKVLQYREDGDPDEIEFELEL
ncbi:MAG: GNAT family N-acetyltransferase [Candidatus Heimdallarchaeota archaeon]|nr:GNAT family N-acetyltransferase [Candidatus Heimdallarchaeota archaeon]MCK4290738.1 GNAT family N-acetyltransferase [Candidatus Heimdallarchaeota archaeon]